MITISKEKFVKALTNIEKGLDERHEFSTAMEKFSDSYYVCNLCDAWLNTAISLLEDAVGDKESEYSSMISWYLFEMVDKKIYLSPHSKYNDTDKEIEIDVSTPEALYDYFVKYGDNDNE